MFFFAIKAHADLGPILIAVTDYLYVVGRKARAAGSDFSVLVPSW